MSYLATSIRATALTPGSFAAEDCIATVDETLGVCPCPGRHVQGYTVAEKIAPHL